MTTDKLISTLEMMATKSSYPHKFLLLLILLNEIDEQASPNNRFSFDSRIEAKFLDGIKEFNLQILNRPFRPFFHLKTDGIWKLTPLKGRESKLAKMSSADSKRDIVENIEYGSFTSEVFTILCNQGNRDLIKQKLRQIISRYSSSSQSDSKATGSTAATSLFQHEQSALEQIAGLLEDTAMEHVSNVLIWELQSRLYLEYDLIIISESGIYVVELKHWSGHIEITPYQWRIDSVKYRTDPHKNNSYKSRVLKGLYNHNFVNYPAKVWVESIVVLTNDTATIENADSPEAINDAKHNFTFKSVDDFVSFIKRRDRAQKLLTQHQIQKKVKLLETVGPQLANVIESMISINRRMRLKNIKEIIAAFLPATESPIAEEKPKRNSLLSPGDSYDVYEVIELLGQGKETQIYKAKAKLSSGEPATIVLKLFNAETPQTRVLAELEAGTGIHSPYIVAYERMGHWQGERFFVTEDFIPGKTLRKVIDEGLKPTLEEFETLARSLLEGLRAMHEGEENSSYIHGDIKPDNIIITPEGKPVIIDLGTAGPPRIAAYQGTPHYVAPDTINGADRDFSVRGDLFALGVTLWEWLFGDVPFDIPAIGQHPRRPDDIANYVQIYPWLEKAISASPELSFTTLSEMWEGLVRPVKDTVEPLPVSQDNIEPITPPAVKTSSAGNPFVFYLNTLSNASAGNENAIAESQFTNPLFKRIHAPNPLTQVILSLLKENNNIILTGNAGDGKTTIAIDVIQSLTSRPIGSLVPLYKVPGHNLTLIKDMSELPKRDQATILQRAIEDKNNNYLIVSNTGTLLDAFAAIEDQTGKISLLPSLQADKPESIMNGLFYIINIGQIDSIDTACTVLKRILSQENWSQCMHCQYKERCPIHQNVSLLTENEDLVLSRVRYFYKRLFEYGQRLTMRHMTGHLAYAITSGLDIHRIKELSIVDRNSWSYGFFNRFFGDDSNTVDPLAKQIAPVRIISQTAFGATLTPAFERKLWSKDEVTKMLSAKATAVIQNLYGNNSPQTYDKAGLRRQIRRLAYFVGRFEEAEEKTFVTNFLESPMLIEYTSEGHISGPYLRSMLTQVLHIIQEHFIGIRLPKDSWKGRKDIFITLKTPNSVTVTQMILASFRVDDFSLTVKPRYEFGENINNVFLLRYDGNADIVELALDLPFFDFVARRYDGDLTHQLSPYFSNRLEEFKGRLLADDAEKTKERNELRLLRVQPDRKFEELTLLVAKDGLEVV